jgi:hypothetical protein
MKKKFSKLMGIGLSIALVTSLLVAAVPATALSTPQVTFAYGQSEIGLANADYTITFSINQALTENMSITLTFPEGTTIGTPTASIAAGPGWMPGPVWTDANMTNPTGNWTSSATFRTITKTLVAGEYIGQSGEVILTITGGITNPTTPGDYTLTVGTKKADGITTLETAVTSAAYAITTPYISPLSGIVMAYNSAGILMSQSHSINTGIVAAGPGGTIEVGPGTYDETVNANVAGQTIIGTGEAGTVIIQDVDGDGGAVSGAGTLAINAGVAIPGSTTGVTVDGIVFTPNAIAPQANLVSVGALGQYAKITNCTINSGSASAATITGNASNTCTISNTTIDTTRTGA